MHDWLTFELQRRVNQPFDYASKALADSAVLDAGLTLGLDDTVSRVETPFRPAPFPYEHGAHATPVLTRTTAPRRVRPVEVTPWSDDATAWRQTALEPARPLGLAPNAAYFSSATCGPTRSRTSSSPRRRPAGADHLVTFGAMEPATDPWFARRQVDDRTWHLWERHVHPFLRCNVWLVRGRDRSMLVDTGLGIVSLSEAGVISSTSRSRRSRRHYHFDHVGSLHEFPDRYAHPEAAPYLASSREIGGALHRAGFAPEAWQYFVDSGYVLDDELLDALPKPDFDVDAYAVEPCPANHELGEGDVIDLGDVAYEVLHLPGPLPRLDRPVRSGERHAVLRATRCTTGRCSKASTTAARRRTSRRWNACASCR